MNKMLDTNNTSDLRLSGKLDFVVKFNKRYMRRVTKAHSGLCSDGSKHKPLRKEFSLITSHQNVAPVWAFSISACHIESYARYDTLYQCGSSLKGNQKAKRGSEIFRALMVGCIELISLNKLQQIHDCNTQSRNMAPKGMLG